MVDKKLAVELRQQGLTYVEIAVRLGCSKEWCAKHLSKVEKGDFSQHPGKGQVTKESAIAILREALQKLEAL